MEPKDLKASSADVAVGIVRAAAGAVPWAGGAIAEIVTALIPNQRLDRLSRFTGLMAERLGTLEQDFVRARLQTPAGAAIAEEVLVQAARATSDDRLGYLAAALRNSVVADRIDLESNKVLLGLLSELVDSEVITLAFFDWDRGKDEFFALHEKVLRPVGAEMGSSDADIDLDAIQKSYKAHLVRLGLLQPQFKKARKGELPEFDEKTGMLKASGYRITRLGSMLLRTIDLAGQPGVQEKAAPPEQP